MCKRLAEAGFPRRAGTCVFRHGRVNCAGAGTSPDEALANLWLACLASKGE
jgi:hypothetical protein